MQKTFAHHVIGITSERRVAERDVRRVRARPAETAKVWFPAVANASLGYPTLHLAPAELGVPAAAWGRTNVNQARHASVPQQCRKFLTAGRPMAHCQQHCTRLAHFHQSRTTHELRVRTTAHHLAPPGPSTSHHRASGAGLDPAQRRPRGTQRSQTGCATGRLPAMKLGFFTHAATAIGAATIAATSFLVPTALTAVPASALQVAVPSVLTCAGKKVVKPASYVLACADANAYFSSVHWLSWGRASATATATLVQNTCAPTCAAGKFIRYPAKLSLSKPKMTKLGLLFSVVNYSYTVSQSTALPLTTLPSAR